jgi:hypothetical protein
MSPLQLLVATPLQPIPRGLGFYQIEEQSLFVQLGGIFDTQRFYSYIDSPISRFDIDRRGRLLFFEINAPKQRWQVTDRPLIPQIVEPADIRWLDFRRKIQRPELLTNRTNSVLKLQFSEELPHYNYYLSAIVNDSAGRKIAAFRRLLNGKVSAVSLSNLTESAPITVS